MGKKLVQINSVCNGSTGKIMISIQKEAEKNGYDVYNFFGRGNPANDRCFKFCNKLDIYWHVLITRLFDKHGFGCKSATKKLIKRLKKIKPDVIQLHNIHGYYINIEILFKYLKESNVKVVWTLHDCWAFTGHCAHFTLVKCDKWQSECKKCPQYRIYPKSLIDSSNKYFNAKRKIFCGLKKCSLVTPSKWLANLVEQSFLNVYPVRVINNGIDLNIFKRYSKNELQEIYEKYNIAGCKKIILGVAGIWSEKKGLNDFIDLVKEIKKNGDEDNYIIIMVGITDNIRKKILEKINLENYAYLKLINRTENQIDLAKLYNIADIYYNPTYEDNYPTVNLEAVACKTAVYTYNTGGSPEAMFGYGIVNDKKYILNNYNTIVNDNYVLKKKIGLSSNNMINEYLKIYE